MSNTVSLNISLSSTVKNRLDALAQKIGCENDGLITRALESFLDEEEKQLQRIHEAIETVERHPERLIDDDDVTSWIDSLGSENELVPPHLGH